MVHGEEGHCQVKEVRALDLAVKRWLVAWIRVILVGNSLAAQWLGLGAFTAGGLCSIPGWGPEILQATWHGQKKQ